MLSADGVRTTNISVWPAGDPLMILWKSISVATEVVTHANTDSRVLLILHCMTDVDYVNIKLY